MNEINIKTIIDFLRKNIILVSAFTVIIFGILNFFFENSRNVVNSEFDQKKYVIVIPLYALTHHMNANDAVIILEREARIGNLNNGIQSTSLTRAKIIGESGGLLQLIIHSTSEKDAENCLFRIKELIKKFAMVSQDRIKTVPIQNINSLGINDNLALNESIANFVQNSFKLSEVDEKDLDASIDISFGFSKFELVVDPLKDKRIGERAYKYLLILFSLLVALVVTIVFRKFKVN